MATYTASQLGLKAPAGGFQEYGWYSGRQMIGGTFGEPGVIHPSSSQQGAGQAVSKEVIAQTNPANVAYIQQQQQTTQPVAPTVTPNAVSTPSIGTPNASATAPTAQQPSINLTQQYNDLYAKSGVQAKEAELSAKTDAYNAAVAKINDNPYLSEATRVGRVQKLTIDFTNSTANLKNDIATATSNIQTQLSMQEKQYQYDTAAYDKAVEQATAAAKASKANTHVTESTDDAGNVTITVINSDTGAIISQQSLGQVAKATKTSPSGGTPTPSKSVVSSFNADADTVGWSKEEDSSGNQVDISPFMKLVIKYASKMTLDQIYEYYMTSSLGKNWGAPGEDKQMITALYNQARGL